MLDELPLPAEHLNCCSTSSGASFLLSACTSGNEAPEEHVWQDQTEVLDQVRQVEQVLEEANAKKRLELQRQTE